MPRTRKKIPGEKSGLVVVTEGNNSIEPIQRNRELDRAPGTNQVTAKAIRPDRMLQMFMGD